MATRTRKIWNGNEQLARLVAPVTELHPHPSNPRRGDIDALRSSLQRFGQQRPILALPDGTIVAGHHVYYAAVAEEWTHVAVIRSDLGGEEVKAYLAADNRTAELGEYDEQSLAALLGDIQSNLIGTGYTNDDVDFLLAMIGPAEILHAPTGLPPGEQPLALGTANVFRIQLAYDRERYIAMVQVLDQLTAKYEVDTYSEAVERALNAALAN